MVVAYRKAAQYGIRSLSSYTLRGAFQALPWSRTHYWTGIVKDDEGSYSVFLDRMVGQDLIAAGSVVLEVEDDPDNTEGEFWDITGMVAGSKTIAIGTTDTSIEIPITINPIAGWFRQRAVVFRIVTPSNCEISPSHTRFRLQFEPADAPPVASLTSSGGTIASGGTIGVDWALSAACYDDVEMNWEKSGPLAPFITAPPTVIAAGLTSGTVTFTEDTGGTPTDACTITPHYERTTVAYEDHRMDQSIPGGRFSIPYDIYVDQNLWVYSNQWRDGVQETNRKQTFTDGPFPFLPGHPTALQSGGVTASLTTGKYQEIHFPSETTPVDPFTGEKIGYLVPWSDVSGYPYHRNDFDTSLCGGNRQLLTLRKYIYGAYQIAPMTGTDVDKNHWCHEIGYRTRTLDLNHAIAICSTLREETGTPPAGMSNDGTTGQTVTTIGGVDYWFWEQINFHPAAEWGIEEGPDGNPIFWFKDVIDEVTTFADATDQLGMGRDTVTLGLDEGNPIYRSSRVKGDNATASLGGPITVSFNSIGDTIERASGSWVTDGYIDGSGNRLVDQISVKDAANPANNGTHTIAATGSTSVFLAVESALTVEGAGALAWRTGSIASSYEGSATLRAADVGTCIYNIQLQMSDTEFPAGSLPFWPNFYQNHSPRGNAMMVDSPTGHTFTKA